MKRLAGLFLLLNMFFFGLSAVMFFAGDHRFIIIMSGFFNALGALSCARELDGKDVK